MEWAGIDWAIPLQIVVASLLGAAIGLEREISSQPAGLRTHMLVSLGAALFTLAGANYAHSDPTRIAAQVVTGVGFLGGGAILREGATVRGLTTAASLWITAAVGLAVGLERWGAAVFATAVSILVLIGVRWFERELLPSRRLLEVTLTVELATPLDHVVEQAKAVLPKSRVLSISYDPDGQKVVMAARPPADNSLTDIAEHLRELGGVHGVAISA